MSSPQRLIKNCHVVYPYNTEADWIRPPLGVPLFRLSGRRLSFVLLLLALLKLLPLALLQLLLQLPSSTAACAPPGAPPGGSSWHEY